MKILLTGKNGQVGFELRRSLSVLGDIFAVDIEECDLQSEHAVKSLVQSYRPDVIINPAAYTAVDRAETDIDLCESVNTIAPGILATEAEKLGAMMIHFSTDYVFDGKKKTPYTEGDETNPQSVYGLTKLKGEKLVESNCSRHLILRTSWVVGAHGGNFAKTMLRLASEKDQLSVVADQYGAPTSAAVLGDLTSHLVRQAIHNPADFPYGLYHATASGSTNWHEYACHVIEKARASGKKITVPSSSIKPICSSEYPTPAKRPGNSQLDTSKFRNTFKLNLPDWKVSLDHILDQIL